MIMLTTILGLSATRVEKRLGAGYYRLVAHNTPQPTTLLVNFAKSSDSRLETH